MRTKYEIMIKLQAMAQELMKLSEEVAALDADKEEIHMVGKYHGEFGVPGQELPAPLDEWWNRLDPSKKVTSLHTRKGFNEALNTFKNINWSANSVEDYRAYYAMKRNIQKAAKELRINVDNQFSPEPIWYVDVVRKAEEK